MFQNQRILITGGSGFIGSYLTKKLVTLGADVVVVDNFRRASASRLDEVKEKIQLINADIRKVTDVEKELGSIDAIFHLAAINGTQNFYKHSQEVLDVALRGTLEIFDLGRNLGVRDIFVASSSEVYHQPEIIPTPETISAVIPDVWNPRFSYGGGKLAQEIITANYYDEIFTRKIIFRPHNIYGKNMGDGHVIPNIIDKIISAKENNQKHIKINGDGMQTRSFMYIEDFVEALCLIYSKGENKNIYHLGVTEEVTIKELIDKIQSKMGTELSIVSQDAPSGETKRRCPDVSKLAELGFIPKYNLDRGLSEII